MIFHYYFFLLHLENNEQIKMDLKICKSSYPFWLSRHKSGKFLNVLKINFKKKIL